MGKNVPLEFSTGLLALLEKLLEKRQPSAYGDELLTDKEVAYLLK